MMKILYFLDQCLAKCSLWGLIVSVMLMLTLTVLNILLRWFGESFMWMDSFVRHLVFLSAFLGGTLATGKRGHIGIDILGKYLEGHKLIFIRNNISRIVDLTSIAVLLWLCSASYDFMKIELEYGRPVFLGIHSGFLVAITPFGFSLMAYRSFYLFISSFFKADPSAPGPGPSSKFDTLGAGGA